MYRYTKKNHFIEKYSGELHFGKLHFGKLHNHRGKAAFDITTGLNSITFDRPFLQNYLFHICFSQNYYS